MNYSTIRPLDVANGPGIRVSLYVSGCEHKCHNCFNQETWDPNFGNKFNRETVDRIFELLKHPHVQGLTILGGDPFYPGNRTDIHEFVLEFCSKFEDEKDIWIYTGYTWEYLFEHRFEDHILETLCLIDVLVDGPFIESLKDLNLRFRGSSNQRLIDVKSTIYDYRIDPTKPKLWEG